MAAGPILIFDKSALQALSLDEAVMLDNFFITNITPLFLIEALADLEKEMRRGRTPEAVVGELAHKTPDMDAVAGIHHVTLLCGELLGVEPVEMGDGRPIIAGSGAVQLSDSVGVMIKSPPEAEALERWRAGDFLDTERQTAKGWRRALGQASLAANAAAYRELVVLRRPRNLVEARTLSYSYLATQSSESLLRFGASRFGVDPWIVEAAASRFRGAGRPPLRDFAPYLHHLLEVEAFFYVSIAADLIGSARTSNAVDMAYLYYLPFCMVFTSNDTLHARVVPQFLRPNQTFVDGRRLKKDLARICEHYAQLPEDVRRRGLLQFATYPPALGSSVVEDTWDKHCPIWRKHAAAPPEPSSREGYTEARRRLDEIQNAPPGTVRRTDVDFMALQRKVRIKKGRWWRFSQSGP